MFERFVFFRFQMFKQRRMFQMSKMFKGRSKQLCVVVRSCAYS